MVWINRAMESLWILTLVLVPLAFLGREYGEWSSAIGSYELPKITILRTLAGLIAALWLIEWLVASFEARASIIPALPKNLRLTTWTAGLREWLREQPVGWLMLAVFLYLCTTLLSTFLSASISVSMWGDIPGQDSYSTYTVLAYLVVFGAIATHLKTSTQLWRLLGAIVVMGVLVAGYAISQHYGHDFLDLIEPPNTQRTTSTLGNATFAGAVLLMTIPLSVMLATLSLKTSLKNRDYWLKLTPWIIIIAVQLLGMALTSTRGPWFGTILGLAGLVGLTVVLLGWRDLTRATLSLGAPLIITAIVLVLSSGSVRENLKGDGLTTGSAAEVAAGRIATVGQSTLSQGLGGRTDVWSGSWRLMIDRPWFRFDDISLSPARSVIGYGPEFFRGTYLLESPPGFRSLPSEPAHAHNLFVHQAVEQGFLGVLTFLGVFAAFFLVGGHQLLKGKSRYSSTQST